MGSLLAIVQLIAVPPLFAVTMAIFLAGTSRPLNLVDYSRVSDPAALHRWAGTRLLLMPVAFLVGGLVSFNSPGVALPVLGATTVVCVCAGAWVALGAERFQGAPLSGVTED